MKRIKRMYIYIYIYSNISNRNLKFNDNRLTSTGTSINQFSNYSLTGRH